MDWTRAIEINKAALLRILAELVALLAAFEGGVRLPKPVHRSLGLGLYKAEGFGDSAFYCVSRESVYTAAKVITMSLKPSLHL